MRSPASLSSGGARLWRAVADVHDLDAAQLVILEEACRAKDRLDRLESGPVLGEAGDRLLVVHDLTQAKNGAANLMKQLLTALRLPNPRTGKRPQRRSPRGAYGPRRQ